MRRIGQPREIADAIPCLASQEANYITGKTLSVAGDDGTARNAHVPQCRLSLMSSDCAHW